MTKNELRELQLASLSLLEEIDTTTKKLNIDYYMIGGTLLGAIRHKGFIPWDYDLDIAMKRDDYDKLLNYYKNNSSDNFFYSHYETEKNHYAPHAILKLKNTIFGKSKNFKQQKLTCYGIGVDIFPLDSPPKSTHAQKKQIKKIKIFKKLVYYKRNVVYGNTKFIKRVLKSFIHLFLKPFSYKFLNKKLDNTMKKYNYQKNPYLISMASHYSYNKQFFRSEIYGKPIKYDFENKKFYGVNQYDFYLKQIYGDYMTPAPHSDSFEDYADLIYIDNRKL